MNRKKVLIITYYWPPSGGAGVQRWLKFVKYLRTFGWEPILYTPLNPEYPVLDESLAKDIPSDIKNVQQAIWEPYSLYKKFTGKKKEERVYSGFLNEEKTSWTHKLSVFIRGNFFIPDARKFWIKPSIKFLTKYLKDYPVDAIISTGPPHSAHLIALGVNQKLGTPWLADFRDPWTEIDFYDQLMLTGFADRKHRRLEKQVLTSADVITTIGWTMEKGVKKLGAKKTKVITNGFDHEDFSDELDAITPDGKFNLVHIGSLNKDRDPVDLWKVLSQLIKRNALAKEDLKITLMGKVDAIVFASLEQYNLEEYVVSIPYLPHSEVFPKLKEAQILLLPLNNVPSIEGIITGKIFEYLAAKRPIICIGSKTGDAARVIEKAKAGHSVNFNSLANLEKIVLDYYHLYKENKLELVDSKYEEYSRKHLTSILATTLDRLLERDEEK